MITIHAAIEYLKYRWKAKNRHGVHSPFAYAFVADVIENRQGLAEMDIVLPWAELPDVRYDMLVRGMMRYYGYEHVAALPVAGNGVYDVLLVSGEQPEGWKQLITDNWPRITANSAVVVQDIHKSLVHSRAWNKVCQAGYVKMSIDLYGIGVLFFRKEMLVPQGFVLRV